MEKYNPNIAPDPEEWNGLDEGECMMLVRNYHESKKIELPDPDIHAILHTVVETQAAMGDDINTAKTISRLIDEGLDRHEALHAIGYIVVGHMHKVMENQTPFNETEFNSELDELTVEKWKKICDE